MKAGIEPLDQSRNGIVDARVLKERQQPLKTRRYDPGGDQHRWGEVAPSGESARCCDYSRCPQDVAVDRA